ncbi:MAG: PIF1 family DEAD/DEAH box helicase [Candidatus Paceibacterota bacterium]|nr:PIF1 family DEAD/DEAH box helicase [bacterium]
MIFQNNKKILSSSEMMARGGIGKRRENRNYLSFDKPDIKLSDEGKKLLKLLEKGGNVFLTGRAGTGKTTFLKYFRATAKKNVVVLAPTGVAAVNIQGQTIHSFFKFRPGVTEKDVKKAYKNREIYENIDILIIDEISMVRADLFDCIEKFLRINGPNPGSPFGGIQIIVVGDLYQLPPIVQGGEDMIFKIVYKSPYFFDANCFKLGKFSMIELQQVYRQSDLEFIELLDSIRMYRLNDSHLLKINQRVLNSDNYDNLGVILVTNNYAAERINYEKLTSLSGSEKKYKGFVDGEFKSNDLPTLQDLFLKEGAQVMLLNNDPKGRWINGDIVKVIKMEDDYIRVMFDDGSFDDVSKYKWEKVKFALEGEGKIKSEIVGNFVQFPMKLSWAITIHKGQGKTYEKVIIDFGGGTFAPGQAYVALSRCRSLAGLHLKRPLEYAHIIIDERVEVFMQEYPKLEL